MRLHAATAVSGGCSCGAPAAEADEEGYCLRCGRRDGNRSAPVEVTDHMEQEIAKDFAAVGDLGLRHGRNEDRFAIYQGAAGAAVVVCDGVSSSQRAEVASSAVAEGILESLTAALDAGSAVDAEQALRQAIARGKANLATATPPSLIENPPSTTVVCALLIGLEATIAWLGDSRAYWIDEHGAVQLTTDHSWQNDVVAAGEMTLEEASAAPQAHAITRWVGVDANDAIEAAYVRRTLSGPGTLLLCTDGLWNYVPTQEAMFELMQHVGSDGANALQMARRLVDFARLQGGHDNITAAVLRVTG